MNLVDLGRRVRAVRVARRLTLEEVVARTDFTVSWLSKIENGQLSPSLEGLVRLAEVLECGLNALVAGLAAEPQFVVVRSGEGETLPAKNGRSGVGIRSLAGRLRGRQMHPTIVHLSGQGTRKHPDHHDGERFLFVLEGSVRLAYGDERIVLGPGDSVYLSAVIPHTLQPLDRAKARVLSISSEPAPSGNGAEPVRRVRGV